MQLARADLLAVWGSLDHSNPVSVRDVLLLVMPDLVATYGTSAAAIAADFFDELRDVSGAAGRFSALAAAGLEVVAIEASTRWGLGSLFKGDPAASLGALSGVLDRAVKQSARDTIDGSVRHDPRRPRYARVPSGAHSCSFCLMLASRGPVYGSKADAGGAGNKYHGNCDCQAVPVWSGSDMDRLKSVRGYNPDALYEKYLDVHDPGMTSKQTAQAWRAEYGNK